MPTIFYHGVFAGIWTGLRFREGGRFRPCTWSDGGDLCKFICRDIILRLQNLALATVRYLMSRTTVINVTAYFTFH